MKPILFGIPSMIVFIVLLGISLTSEDRMNFLFNHFSYYIILLLVLLWGITAYRLFTSLNISFRALLRRVGPGMVVALLLTMIIALTVKTDFRTLSDETNLLSVSKSMAFNKEIQNVTTGKYYYDNFRALGSTTPKRPFIYPFLTSLVHSLIGFHPFNNFLVNYTVFFFLLTAIFISMQKYTDSLSALATLFMVLACPVITLYAACGGFDFINAAFFFFAFASLFYYLENPSKERFALTWLTFLILSNTRYESVLYFLIVCIGLFLFRHIRWQAIKTHVTLFSTTPLLMLPFLWQRILMPDKHENPSDVAPFGFEHFFKHLNEFWLAQFDFSYYLPYANLLNLIAFVGIGLLVWGLIVGWRKGRTSASVLQFTSILAVCVLANLLLIFCYYYGRYTHPISARLFIIITLMLALIPAGVKKLFPKLLDSRALLLLSLVMFFLYHPIAIEDRFTNTLTQNREFRQTRKFVDRLNTRQVLLISNRPGQFAALNYGAVKFSYANRHAKSLNRELDRGLYRDIIVMQRIRYRDRKPMEDYTLSKKFRLKKLEEIQITKSYFMRISKVY